jgi:hypothetical protein
MTGLCRNSLASGILHISDIKIISSLTFSRIFFSRADWNKALEYLTDILLSFITDLTS